MKILICTFGKDLTKIFSALKIHKYDQLILIMEKGSQESEEYKKVLEFERFNINKPNTIIVNPKEFFNCYKNIQKVIIQHQKDDIIINISSGTKLLSMASILCAFNLGISAYHYEQNKLFKLPVFKDITIKERLTKRQIDILLIIRDGMKWETLKNKLENKYKYYGAVIAFNKLKKLGLIEPKLDGKTLKIHLSSTGKRFKEFLKT